MNLAPESLIHQNRQSSLLDGLNDVQRTAVQPGGGIFVVRAGAGSGKTRVITHRIAYLIEHWKAEGNSILAMTFTNKAAREMRERMDHMLHGKNSSLPTISTFHGYCVRLLKQFGFLIDLPTFTLIDDADQEKLAKKILHHTTLPHYLKLTPRKLLSIMSNIENGSAPYDVDPVIAQLYSAYQHEKKISKCLDFDDLLSNSVRLLRQHEAVRISLQQRIRHLLVDEYQDTNKIQHELITLLCNTPAENKFALDSLCVVGDEDQSIYSWRGATISNIMHFNNSFPQATIILLEQNYRSTTPILHAANTLISRNSQRIAKNLWSRQSSSDPVYTVFCNADQDEASFIAHMCNYWKKTAPLSSIGILYRSHHLSRTIEEYLVKQNIAYSMVAGVRFYEREEIKDILAYARIICNPFDRLSLIRALNTPTRGLGTASQEEVLRLWDAQPLLNAFEIIQLYSTQSNGKKHDSLKNFLNIIANLSGNDSPIILLETIINRTQFLNWIHTHYEEDDEVQQRIANIQELQNAACAAQDRGITTMADFLQEIALMQNPQELSGSSKIAVNLMTMHAAKGLEFDHVMIAGVEEQILPSPHAAIESEQLEEERRLLYVGMTRARKKLFLFTSGQRFSYGSLQYQRPSRFLYELDTATNYYQLPAYASYQMGHIIDDWHQYREKFASPGLTRKNESLDMASSAKYTPSTKQINTGWKPHQRVIHKLFGTGTILLIDTQHPTPFLTIKFDAGIKKISSNFVVPA